MRFTVSNKTLMTIAGIVWTIAGANILRIGIECWMNIQQPFWLIFLGAVIIFCAFHFGVFSKMYHKNRKRIMLKHGGNNPLSFIDTKGWIIMIFMITLGVTIRHYSLMPLWFIANFYTGLSTALIITGLRFLRHNKAEDIE